MAPDHAPGNPGRPWVPLGGNHGQDDKQDPSKHRARTQDKRQEDKQARPTRTNTTNDASTKATNNRTAQRTRQQISIIVLAGRPPPIRAAFAQPTQGPTSSSTDLIPRELLARPKAWQMGQGDANVNATVVACSVAGVAAAVAAVAIAAVVNTVVLKIRKS